MQKKDERMVKAVIHAERKVHAAGHCYRQGPKEAVRAERRKGAGKVAGSVPGVKEPNIVVGKERGLESGKENQDWERKQHEVEDFMSFKNFHG